MFVDKPVQEVSIDAVAAEAGISRGLLFHFPDQDGLPPGRRRGGRTTLPRNARPDDGATGEVALEQVTRRFIEQIRRRRGLLCRPRLRSRAGVDPDAGGREEFATTLRARLADLVIERCGYAAAARPVVHAWVAYVEDRAIESSADASNVEVTALVAHCTRALDALQEPPPSVRVFRCHDDGRRGRKEFGWVRRIRRAVRAVRAVRAPKSRAHR